MGPDNGLLVPAAERLGGIDGAWELTAHEYRLEPVSHTFHARDVFSPAAAHMAAGVEPDELGPRIDPASLVRLPLPEPSLGDGWARAHVIVVDRFGNVQLNLHTAHLERLGIQPGVRVELVLPLERYYAVTARTFADARPGDIILYEDAYWNAAVAISGGNAAQTLSLGPGDDLRLRVLD